MEAMLPSSNSMLILEGLFAADAWAARVAAGNLFALHSLGGPTLKRPGASSTSNLSFLFPPPSHQISMVVPGVHILGEAMQAAVGGHRFAQACHQQ